MGFPDLPPVSLTIYMQLSNLIRSFIDAQLRKHPQLVPWLADWSIEWETQIMCDTEGLEPQYATLTDLQQDKPTFWADADGYQHRNIRIPYGAMTPNPAFYDRQVIGPIHQRWNLLGNTGWNWTQKKSMWVGFDYDGITHTNGLSAEQLEEVKNRALSLTYVIARTSKSGTGIHLIVPLKPWITTRTHTEHAKLAKAVLRRMSQDCDYDFSASADQRGGNLWNYSREVTANGLRRIT